MHATLTLDRCHVHWLDRCLIRLLKGDKGGDVVSAPPCAVRHLGVLPPHHTAADLADVGVAEAGSVWVLQHLQELMHQMQASAAQGMAAAYSSQGFPIASLDAAGHPHMRQWRQ